MLRGAELVRVPEDIGAKLSFHDCILLRTRKGARTVTCRMRGRNCGHQEGRVDGREKSFVNFSLPPNFCHALPARVHGTHAARNSQADEMFPIPMDASYVSC